MLKNKILLILLAVIFGASAFAQVEPPQDPFLPYYYVRGTVSVPSGSTSSPASRTVVFYRDPAGLTAGRYVRAVTNASGYYELNAFELSYYFGDAVEVGGATPVSYRVAVLNNPADNLGGDPQTITLQTGQGFTEQNFTLTAGGGRISTFTLISDFLNGAAIPNQHADPDVGGSNASMPLGWSNLPAGTGSFALSVVDVSADNTVHWLVKNIPSATTSLLNNASVNPGTEAMPDRSVQLTNYLDNMRYDGPNPPAGDPHNYVVTVYALQNTIASVPANLNEFTAAINGATLLGQATITGTFSRASAGGVALNIARQGSDIRISWNNTTSPSPQIFFRTGNGTGQFANAYDASWLPVNPTTPNFDFGAGNANYNSGFILHTGQVGAGAGEAYYKAISAGVVVSSSGGLATFANAGAVGKVNVTLTAGWNQIAYPFESPAAAPISVDEALGGNYANGDQLWAWRSGSFIAPRSFNSSSGRWGEGFDLVMGEGYGLNVVSTTPGAIKTFIGRVNYSNLSRTISSGWNLIGNPFPMSLSGDAGLNPTNGSVNGDQVWEWRNGAFQPPRSFNGTVWPAGNFEIGKGYGYNHVGSGVNWRLNSADVYR